MSIIFDTDSPNWLPTPEYNKVFLKQLENYFNDILNRRGNVFINEINDDLGLRRTRDGQVMGWVSGPGVHISFNMRDLENGYIEIDFNHMGNILDKI
jgi:hypothetical protein